MASSSSSSLPSRRHHHHQHNPFSTLPTTPHFHPSPSPPSLSLPIPIPKYPPKPLKTPAPPPKPQAPPRDPTRAVLLGPTGVSYLLPGAPFEFQFSYSETPKAKPLSLREPAFLPFAPPTMPRPWTGKAPLKKGKKESRNKIRVLGEAEVAEGSMRLEVVRVDGLMGRRGDGRSREEVLGEELTREEIEVLVKGAAGTNRQVNLGRDGFTHNMLELIHTHWKSRHVCKIKCKGVPTVDMDNVCRHLEEKTGGKVIHRVGGTIYLFRGRNYNYRTRPQYPTMLWKPAAPVYPKLIQDVPEGLPEEEAIELRRKGKKLLPILRLGKNGVYINLVKDVRQAFEGSSLVKIDCRGLKPSDYKKIGAKLMELVPCTLLSFDDEQILMCRRHDWKSMYSNRRRPSIFSPARFSPNDPIDPDSDESGDGAFSQRRDGAISSPRIMSLWKHALESSKACLLLETRLDPDTLLAKVEEFQVLVESSQNSDNSLINSGEDDNGDPVHDDGIYSNEENDDYDGFSENDLLDSKNEYLSPPLGSLPVDDLAMRLIHE